MNAGAVLISNARRHPGARVSEFCLFDIVLQDNILGFAIPEAETFVMVDLITAKKLETLQGQAGVCTKAVVEGKTLGRLASNKKKQPLEISVNIYGMELDALAIGKQLSKAEAFLQHPFHLEDGVEYLNPQFFDLGDGPKYMTHLVGIDESKIRAKALSDAVEDALTSLGQGIPALTTDELDTITTDDLITPLKE
jgi:hypothetical protein